MTSRNADLIIGGHSRHSPAPDQFVDSRIYFQDDIVWCVQRARVLAAWKNFFTFIDSSHYALFAAAIFPLIFIIYLLCSYEKRPIDIWTAMLVIMTTVTLMSPAVKCEKASARLYHTWSMFTCLCLLSVYMAFSLDHMLQVHYEHQISTFDEVVEEKFRLVAEPDMKMYLIERKQLTQEQIDEFFVCNDPRACMEVLKQSENVAVAVSRQFIRTKYYDENVFCFARNIRSNLIALKMLKTRLQINEWNKSIRQIVESGLIHKWLHSTTRKTKEIVTNTQSQVEHYLGLLCFTVGGIGIASIVAIVEQIIHLFVRRHNHHRYWDVANWVIDGKRHKCIFNQRKHTRPAHEL